MVKLVKKQICQYFYMCKDNQDNLKIINFQQFNLNLEKLTSREHDVLKLFIRGRTDKQIANELYIGEITVRLHRRNIRRKFGLCNILSNNLRAYLIDLFNKYRPELIYELNPNATSLASLPQIIRKTPNDSQAIIELQESISDGANINEQDNEGRTSLFAAIEMNRVQIVDFLLEQTGIDVNLQNNYGWTPLHKAANIGSLILVDKLIKRGANPASVTNMRATTVYEAAFGSNSPAIVQILESAGANVNLTSQDGFTPLMVAIWRGNYTVAQYLAERTSDINAADLQGETAFYKAYNSRNYDLMVILLDKGADYHIRPILQPSIIREDNLFTFATEGNIEKVRQFLEKNNFNINQSYPPYERTALHQASENGHFEIVRLLVEHGADVFAKNNHGRTPRDLVLGKNQHIINFLYRVERSRLGIS